MGFTPLPGYPTKWGNKNVQVIDLVGPNPYTVGGEPFPVSSLNFGGIDFVVGGLSSSQTYVVRALYPAAGTNQTVKLMWFIEATGVEAGAIDLSRETVRLLIVAV